MASNKFLSANGVTTVTVLSDAPIQGVGRYGPYTAYRVRTSEGAEEMFYPSARAKEQLDGQPIGCGTVLDIRGEPSQTRDGRPYTRFDIVGIRPPSPDAAAPAAYAARDDDTRMLRCVALKAAAATRGITGEPPEVLSTARAYLDWLLRP